MKRCLFLLLFPICMFISCRKQPVVCTGNCYSLNVRGRVVSGLTNKPVPNVPLIISQAKFHGIISSSRPVQEFKSKSDGTFNTSPEIDTTVFSDGYFLSLKVKDNKDYMTLPDRGYNRLYDLTNNTFSNVTFTVFPKTSLKIKLNRVENDDFNYFSVDYYFIDNQVFFPLKVTTPKHVTQKELNVPTSTDLFTIIMVTKRNSSGMTTIALDSIKCLKNKSNVFTVNY